MIETLLTKIKKAFYFTKTHIHAFLFPKREYETDSDIQDALGISIAKKPTIDQDSRLGILVILIFVVGSFLWSYFSQIESAVLAPGKIVVAGNRRVIQHLEGGIVSAIYVKNGMVVNKGDRLLKIDDTQSTARYDSEHGQVLRLLANEARLMALIQDKDELTFPESITSKILSPEMEKFLNNQKASFQAERATGNAHLQILRQREIQLQQQIHGTQAQLNASIQQLKLIKEELAALHVLAKDQLVDRSRLLSMQREEQRLAGLRGEYEATIANLHQKIGENKLQILSEQEKLQKQWNHELRDVREKLALAIDREKSATDILSRTLVISPIDGTILNLRVFTIGGVVKPGEPLLDIIPKNEELVIDAKINPLDIDVVHTGLKAKIVLSALKTRTTPMLIGKVIYVSADTSTDERTQQTYYEARIHIDKNELKKITDNKSLYPGMPVEVMIITNQLSPWEYFIDPIRRSFSRAFREE